jgi:hypothetical protein
MYHTCIMEGDELRVFKEVYCLPVNNKGKKLLRNELNNKKEHIAAFVAAINAQIPVGKIVYLVLRNICSDIGADTPSGLGTPSAGVGPGCGKIGNCWADTEVVLAGEGWWWSHDLNTPPLPWAASLIELEVQKMYGSYIGDAPDGAYMWLQVEGFLAPLSRNGLSYAEAQKIQERYLKGGHPGGPDLYREIGTIKKGIVALIVQEAKARAKKGKP